MKKRVYLLLLILVGLNCAYGQTLQVKYSAVSKSDSISQNFNLILDNSDHSSLFYSEEFCALGDPEIHNPAVVYFEDNKSTIYDDVEGVDIKVELPSSINWELMNQTKQIGNVNLQKARTKLYGKEYTAYYNPEIVVNDGPYIFKGLPGLIYQIENEELSITLLEISSTVSHCYKRPKKVKTITLEDYKSYNQELLEILKEGYKKQMRSEDANSIIDVLLGSVKKDILRTILIN